MRVNALTIKNQKALKKPITQAKYFHSADYMWNSTQPTDVTLSIIQEEKGSQKVLHPWLCCSKSLYSTPSAAFQRLLCAKECRTALILKFGLISFANHRKWYSVSILCDSPGLKQVSVKRVFGNSLIKYWAFTLMGHEDDSPSRVWVPHPRWYF